MRRLNGFVFGLGYVLPLQYNVSKSVSFLYIHVSNICMFGECYEQLIQSTSKDRPAKYLYLNSYVSISVESMMEYWIDKLTISP